MFVERYPCALQVSVKQESEGTVIKKARDNNCRPTVMVTFNRDNVIVKPLCLHLRRPDVVDKIALT